MVLKTNQLVRSIEGDVIPRCIFGRKPLTYSKNPRLGNWPKRNCRLIFSWKVPSHNKHFGLMFSWFSMGKKVQIYRHSDHWNNWKIPWLYTTWYNERAQKTPAKTHLIAAISMKSDKFLLKIFVKLRCNAKASKLLFYVTCNSRDYNGKN